MQKCNIFLVDTDLPMELHHVKPHFMGGSSKTKNLVLLCRPCHIELHQNLNSAINGEPGARIKILSYMEEGLLDPCISDLYH